MMVDIVEGFLQGALETEGFTDVEKCVKDAETVLSDVEVAVTDFKKEDIEGVAAGIKELGLAMTVVQ